MTRPPNFFRDAVQQVPALYRKANATGRDSDPRRTLPLNGSAWQRLRASVMSLEPLCRHCTARGLTVVATDLDHADGNPGNNDMLNLCPLCHSCHSRKTAAERAGTMRYGCDVDGRPLDPNHHWNEKSPEPDALDRIGSTDAQGRISQDA